MNSQTIWIIITVLSLILGVFRYFYSSRKVDKNERNKFIFWSNELLNHSISVFIGGVIVYYFISIRYPLIVDDGAISTMDLILLLIFLTSFIGWLPYTIGNITKSVEKIVSKVIEKID